MQHRHLGQTDPLRWRVGWSDGGAGGARQAGELNHNLTVCTCCRAAGQSPGSAVSTASPCVGMRMRDGGFCKLSQLAKPVGATSTLSAELALFCKLDIEYIE
jgi:hypothetical protein